MSAAEKLRVLLAEKIKPERIELPPPHPPEKWMIIARLYLYDIFITAYENGEVQIDTGPERTRSEISEYFWGKYKYKEKEAKTEEERERIKQRRKEEENQALEDFKQRRFEKYLKSKDSISYFAAKHMWGDEIARRLSKRYGFEVKFVIDSESGFFITFDSKGMDDEQLINEIMKRVDAIAKARKMFLSRGMMNKFLKSKGMEVK